MAPIAHLDREAAAIAAERARIARALHDSVIQLLASATLVAESLPEAYARDQAEGARRVTRISELNRRALSELRALMQELRPGDRPKIPFDTVDLPATAVTALVRHGLVAALASHVDLLVARGVAVVLELGGVPRQVPEVEEAFYQVAAEALHNAIKHARATQVVVTLSCENERLCLEVRDDGVGFDPLGSRTQRDGHGHGLAGMRERADEIGGWLGIDSTSAGSLVRLEAPPRPLA